MRANNARAMRLFVDTEERPRERLLAHGPSVLTDAELIALIVGGTSRGNGGVVNACRLLLGRLGDVGALRRCSARELMGQRGIGRARACALVAAVELGRRIAAVAPRTKQQITTSERAYRQVRGRLEDLQQEVFIVLALDGRNRVISQHAVAQGSATAVEVHPREVFLPLVREGAASMIAAHNHPSGDPEPSADDLRLTERLQRAGELIGIPLLDHIIVGAGSYVSLADRRLLG